MAKATRPIPEGFHTVTASLTVRDAAAAIDFYKKALGAQELMRMPMPDGKVGHAELKIGDSIIFLNDEFPQMGHKSPQTLGGASGSIYLYVEDADKAFKRATDAGATTKMPLTNMFWGDRYGQVVDPFGHVWGLSTHVEDVSPEEMERRSKEWAAQMAQQAQKKTA
jgi:PhnB protein